jgi:hypothetical protein
MHYHTGQVKVSHAFSCRSSSREFVASQRLDCQDLSCWNSAPSWSHQLFGLSLPPSSSTETTHVSLQVKDCTKNGQLLLPEEATAREVGFQLLERIFHLFSSTTFPFPKGKLCKGKKEFW